MKDNKLIWVVGIILVIVIIYFRSQPSGVVPGIAPSQKTALQCDAELQQILSNCPPGNACMPNPAAFICECMGKTSTQGMCDNTEEWTWLHNQGIRGYG